MLNKTICTKHKMRQHSCMSMGLHLRSSQVVVVCRGPLHQHHFQRDCLHLCSLSTSTTFQMWDTPSSSNDAELEHDGPWQWRQIVEHFMSTLRQLHFPVHFFVHLQDSVEDFSWSWILWCSWWVAGQGPSSSSPNREDPLVYHTSSGFGGRSTRW